MRISGISIPLLLSLALQAHPLFQAGMPMMRSIEPPSGKAGDVLVVEGENLGQENVAALYLTDGTTDIKVPMIEQTATFIKFKIPSEAKPWRFALMVLTKDKTPRLIEEPIRITVEPETSGSTISASDTEPIRFL